MENISSNEKGIIETIRENCEKDATGYKVSNNYLLSLLKEKGFKSALNESPNQEKHIENDFQNNQSQALKTTAL